MTKNEILNAIKKLGLEFEEIFMIDYGDENADSKWYDSFFSFSEKYLCKIGVGELDPDIADEYVKDLLSGKSRVVKFWKPKNGETYYVPSFIYGHKSYIWSDNDESGYMYMWLGVVCRTSHEAIHLSKQISEITRRLLVNKKRMENSNTKDIGEYDYLNLFD